MKLHELKPAFGSRRRRKIVGRGEGSGHGGSSTRGMKGQKSRSGDGKMIGFEGGQMPLYRRIPKRGFSNRRFKKEFEIINVGTLEVIFEAGTDINPQVLKEKGLSNTDLPVKILGDGEIKKALKVSAHAFSGSAEEKIKKAGGTVSKIEQTAESGQRSVKDKAKSNKGK